MYKTVEASNDVFYTNKETIEKILKIAKDNKITIKEPIYLDKIKRFKAEELNHIEKNLKIGQKHMTITNWKCIIKIR